MQAAPGPYEEGAPAHAQRPFAHSGDGWDGPPPADAPLPRTSRRRRLVPRPLRLGATLMVLVLVLVLGWGAGLALWSDSRIEHVDALSGAQNTPGTTYLIAGSDRRDGEAVKTDGTEGARTDTIMLLHKAPGGNSYLVSLPRDLLVDVPGQGGYKLNAAYAFGGAPLLVETVEQFTGLTVDHYVEIGFDGVAQVVDAVGHVNLCIDQDVDDKRSGLVMTEGCHDVGGEQALAFVRARYFDPTADTGRQQRQQQFIGALMDRVTSPGILLNPVGQVRMAGAGSGALTTSEGTGIIDVGRMALTARGAMNSGGTLSIPVENPEYQTEHSGVAILTDDAEIDAFFTAVADGSAELTAQE
ncbi:MAG: LCP family protein [Brachybacterium sp.]